MVELRQALIAALEAELAGEGHPARTEKNAPMRCMGPLKCPDCGAEWTVQDWDGTRPGRQRQSDDLEDE
jgi:hypothetical protein